MYFNIIIKVKKVYENYVLNNQFWCNRQKGGCLTLIFFKWTKRRLFFLAKKTIYVAVFYLCIIKLNGSKLCWGATCQG